MGLGGFLMRCPTCKRRLTRKHAESYLDERDGREVAIRVLECPECDERFHTSEKLLPYSWNANHRAPTIPEHTLIRGSKR